VKIVLYIIWALFVAGAAFACIHAVRKARAQERLIASWPKVQANVTGSRQGWTSGVGNSSRNRRYWPAYQFIDPRGVLFVGESEVSCVNRPVAGSFLDVAYNPSDPNQSFEVDSPSRPLIGCVIPAFAFLVLAAFWFIGFLPLG
jgi:hypothetical protein